MKPAEALTEPGSGEDRETLSVLVVYEDLETGLRASEALDRTMQRLQAPVEVQVDFWRSDLFREAAFLQQVTAQQADIVFLSTHGRGQLPRTLHSWLHQWFGCQGGEPRALAVLLDTKGRDLPGVTKMLEELSRAARLAGVDMFLHAAEPKAEWERAIEEIHCRAETKTVLLDEVLLHADRPAFREWGINE